MPERRLFIAVMTALALVGSAVLAQAQTCDPKLAIYPVLGPHNGGTGNDNSEFTCPPHNDNSDFTAAHAANDIFAAAGTPVVACVTGTVKNVAFTADGGLTVTLKDSCGWFYLYSHMDNVQSGLAIGQSITAGDPIGTVGSTGLEVGVPHLHFAVFPGALADAIDPFPLLETVDAASCDNSAVAPIVALSVETTATDFRPEGASAGVPDALEGDTFTVEVTLTVDAAGGPTKGDLSLGYGLSSPYLKAVDAAQSGTKAVGTIEPGAAKTFTFTLTAEQYSLDAPEQPTLQAWYGELSVSQTIDVYGKDHWEFDGGPAQTEGWSAGNAVQEIKVNATDHALAINQGAGESWALSPQIELPAAATAGFNLRVRHYAGSQKGRLHWMTAADPGWSDDKSAAFEAPGDGSFHDIVINVGANPLWAGTVTRLRLTPTLLAAGWYDVDYVRASPESGPSTGDADGDQSVTSQDCNDADPTVYPGAAELCDAVDNDCDDQVDEGMKIGGECTAGAGVCAAPGLNVCAADLLGPECDAVPLDAASDELCDGVDNDCDGETDEDFGLGGDCETGNPACARFGKLICAADGSKAICNAPPAAGVPETCNFMDDDCDGETDEDFNLLDECVAGEGECASPGFLACAENGDVYCKAPLSEGTAERCDGLDNDCDGIIDEGFPTQGEPCEVVQGDCVKTGKWLCDATGLDPSCDITGVPCEDVEPENPDTTTPDTPETGDATGGATTGGAVGPGGATTFNAPTEESGCAAGSGPTPGAAALFVLLLLGLITRRRRFVP